MLDCEQALELISGKLDGVLTAEESAALEEHLAACPACRALLSDFEELHQELPRLAAQPPADLKDRIMEGVRQCKVTPFQSRKKQWRWRSLASLAAVLALVVLGSGTLRQWQLAGSRASQLQENATSDLAVTENAGEPETGSALPASIPTPEPDDQAAAGDGTAEKSGRSQTEPESQAKNTGSQERNAGSQEGRATATPPATPAPTQTPEISTYTDVPEQRANPAGLTEEIGGQQLTQAQAVEKLALYLGWPADSLTVDSSGVLTWLTSEDGSACTITCTGLNEEGTSWVCQVEESTPGTDGAMSCTTYTIPLDGSEITQP